MTMASQVARHMVAPSAGSLLPNPFLYTLPEELWDKQKDFFGYTATFTGANVLPASASATVSTSIQSDSAFIIVGASLLASDITDAAALGYVPQTVQISDQASGRTFFDAPTAVMNVFGSGAQPAYWAMPKLVMPASTISTTLNNLEATARNVRITYWGFKVFNVRQQ